MSVLRCRQFEGPFMFSVSTVFSNLLSNDISSALQKESKVWIRLVPYMVVLTIAILSWIFLRKTEARHPHRVHTIKKPLMDFLGTLLLNLLSNDISSLLQKEVHMKFIPYVVLITIAILHEVSGHKTEVHHPQELPHQQPSSQLMITMDNGDVTHLEEGRVPQDRRDLWRINLRSTRAVINRALGIMELSHIYSLPPSDVINRALGMRHLWRRSLSAGRTVIERPLEMRGSIVIHQAVQMRDARQENLPAENNGNTALGPPTAVLFPSAVESRDERPPFETKRKSPAPQRAITHPEPEGLRHRKGLGLTDYGLDPRRNTSHQRDVRRNSLSSGSRGGWDRNPYKMGTDCEDSSGYNAWFVKLFDPACEDLLKDDWYRAVIL